MYRPRRTRDLGSALTFGGRIPASVGLVLVLLAIATLGSWMARDMSWAALRAGSLLDGQLWRLVTYTLVQQTPTGLIFGGIAIYFFGPWAATRYGDRSFLGYVLFLTLGAGLVTHALGFVLRVPFRDYLGVWPLVDGLVLLWALQNQYQQVLLMFVLPVSGRMLAIITVATNALWALWATSADGLMGLFAFMPPLASLGIAWVVHRGGSGLPFRRWRLGLRDWRLERQLRRRSRHLQVVGKDGSRGKEWMN